MLIELSHPYPEDQRQPVLIPFFIETVPAGFPSPAQGHVERTLDLHELCVQRPASTFFVRATGDSMIDIGIFPGNILVVDRSLEARHVTW